MEQPPHLAGPSICEHSSSRDDSDGSSCQGGLQAPTFSARAYPARESDGSEEEDLTPGKLMAALTGQCGDPALAKEALDATKSTDALAEE